MEYWKNLLHYIEDGFALVSEFVHDEFSVLIKAGRISATYRTIGLTGFGFWSII
jgi:hypothetical protein